MNSEFGLNVKKIIKPKRRSLVSFRSIAKPSRTFSLSYSLERLYYLNNLLEQESQCCALEKLADLQKQYKLSETISIAKQKFNSSLSNDLLKNAFEGFKFTNDVIYNRASHLQNEVKTRHGNISTKRRSLWKSRKKEIKDSRSSHRTKSGLSELLPLENKISLENTQSSERLSKIKLPPSPPSNLTVSNELCLSWNEHVMSLLSNSTAKMLVKDFTPREEQEKLFGVLKKLEDLKMSKYDSNAEKDIQNENREVEAKSCSPEIKSEQCYFPKFSDPKRSQRNKKHVLVKDIYPLSPTQWSSDKESKLKTEKHTDRSKEKKWIDKRESDKSLIYSEQSAVKPSGIPTAVKSECTGNNRSLMYAADEWHAKWCLGREWRKKSVGELLQSMKSINDYERLAAVAVIGNIIIQQRRRSRKIETCDGENEVIEELEKKLSDSCSYVGVAAALTLCVVNRATEQASQVLMNSVRNGEPAERWVAVQCLAECDRHDDCVISELLSHLNGSDVCKARKAEKLIKHLSNFTVSVQYMLAEQLNSTSWQHRLKSCETLTKLSGNLSRDIATKLSFLMWNDWNKDVRTGAAQALGKSGNGKLVHDSLCKNLRSNNKKLVIEALGIITSIGIVSDHLFNLILSCLDTEDDVICLQTLLAISSLQFKGGKVQERLITLASSERNVQIKAAALRGLGFVGDSSRPLRECLLWALRFEKDSNTRLQACSAIVKLGLHDKETMNVLQEVIITESNEKIKSQIGAFLTSMDLKSTGGTAMSETIRQNVQKLCSKKNILARMLIESQDEFQKFLKSQDTSLPENSSRFDASYGLPPVVCAPVKPVRTFDSTLEAFRVRKKNTVANDIPKMIPAVIPFWSESSDNLLDG